jgi:hypothetical protein
MSAAEGSRRGQILFFRFAGWILIVVALTWLVAAGKFSLFITVWGDCFGEGCDALYAENERAYRLLVALGQASLVLGVTAFLFRVSQVLLIGLATFALSVVALTIASSAVGLDLDLTLPVVDVPLGRLVGPFFLELPAAVSAIGGASLLLFAHRFKGPGQIVVPGGASEASAENVIDTSNGSSPST